MAYYLPFKNNPLKTRADAQQMVRDLFTPLIPYLSHQGAALDLDEGGAIFDMQASALEGVARPLWGIIPLVLGGGEFPGGRWCIMQSVKALTQHTPITGGQPVISTNGVLKWLRLVFYWPFCRKKAGNHCPRLRRSS
ncbi:DUF2264 domain-containing protein [Mangrovibacter sp. SLW1]